MPRKKSETAEEPKKKTTRTRSSSTAKNEKAPNQTNEPEKSVIAAGSVNEVASAAETDVALKEAPLPETTSETVPVVNPEADKEQNGSNNGNGYGKQHKHTHPKLGFNFLAQQTLAELRKIAKEIGVTSISARRKDDLIVDILKTQAETMGYRFNGGTSYQSIKQEVKRKRIMKRFRFIRKRFS